MQNICDFVNSVLRNYHIDSSLCQDVQARLNEEWHLDGWISLTLSNRVYVVMKFNNTVFSNEGYVMTDEKVLKVLGNAGIEDISYGEESLEEGIVDLDHGTRFEGSVLKESGIPFGFGCMYDDDGLLAYKGIMINWKRFGYGVSYRDNASVEYEGYWCDDKRCGRGKLYDRRGQLVKEGEWWNGAECSTEYIGDGSQPVYIGIKHLKLEDESVLSDWNVSWFYKLESIEIGDDCFGSVQTFKIEGLKRLKSVKIGNNSFTQVKKGHWDEDKANNQSRSFHILDCESLESIQIGEYSFSDFGGEFELSNLKSLKSIQIGTIGSDSCNFYWSSFVIRGMDMILTIE